MKAQNLTICVPGNKCDKNCEYCISKVTWQPWDDVSLMYANASKVAELASKIGVTNVMFTSKKEPFLMLDQMFWLMQNFNNYWMEVQTNGIFLRKHINECVKELSRAGMNIVAISIDALEDLEKYEETFIKLAEVGILSRVCFNLTKKITNKYGFYSIMDGATKWRDRTNVSYVRQVLFRNISYPSTAPKDHSVVKWIDDNVSQEHYKTLLEQVQRSTMKKTRIIPYTETEIYSYKKLASVCFSDYCIQEFNKTDDIRSIIFHSDGHIYTSWDDPTTVLF